MNHFALDLSRSLNVKLDPPDRLTVHDFPLISIRAIHVQSKGFKHEWIAFDHLMSRTINSKRVVELSIYGFLLKPNS